MNAAEFELCLLELLTRRFPGREMAHEDRQRLASDMAVYAEQRAADLRAAVNGDRAIADGVEEYLRRRRRKETP